MCAAATTAARGGGEEWLARGIIGGGGGGGGGQGQIGERWSHESEHDLALMVSDFLENGGGGSSGPDSSWCSSDSDSGIPDLPHLADNISFYKYSVAQCENELLSLVHYLMLSIRDSDLHFDKLGPCNGSCIRFTLVNSLRVSGYDAAVCTARWQTASKVPGGDHEYIDVINSSDAGSSERLIVDVDFRSHFEIARAVHSYDSILKSLPVVYVGSLVRLKQYLQVMAEAAKSSLRQNAMPLPPWRSLAYLQAKWHSPYQRQFTPNEQNLSAANSADHKQCCEHLKRLQSLLHSEREEERFFKPMNSESNWRMKSQTQRRRHSLFRAP